ncbi:MAG: hypothetical protein OXE92_09175 [Bacteroidetes bacterium]|nr:hypothetical protein [Bacteroidota bacterium]
MKNCKLCWLAFIIFVTLYPFMSCTTPDSLGIFEGVTNIGAPSMGGSILYDSETDEYTITGGGEDIYGVSDEFFFAWKQVEGDLILEANVEFTESTGHPYRKAGWMVRESLDADAAYVDALIHADGLIALQWRSETGGMTHEVTTSVPAPATLRLERTADLFTLYLDRPSDRTVVVANITVNLSASAYAGLVVCAHDPTARATAKFRNIHLEHNAAIGERIVESTLEIMDSHTGERQIVRQAEEHFEAPNWSPDSLTLLYNHGGRLYHMPSAGGGPQMLDTQFADRCNNDHGYSPDGTEIALSHHTAEQGSQIYIVPSTGGFPRLVTELDPSYWHGWSPDAQNLVYCARRNNNYDVYMIRRYGGDEVRLTEAEGLDDGPEYAPDGQTIYFNSDRTGQMKIWQMNPDGTNQMQVTPDDEFGDWFAHPSPDGNSLVFLSYDRSVEGHPPNKDVKLRIMPVDRSEKPKIIAHLFGGQGTINVPSWSPDSRHFAFVSYRLIRQRTQD